MTNFDRPINASPASPSRATSHRVTLPAGSRKLFRSGSSSRSTAAGAMRGMLRNLGEALLKGFLGSMVLLALALVAWEFFNMPEVEVSHATGKCVRVVYADGRTDTCDNMPDRFDRVWVR